MFETSGIEFSAYPCGVHSSMADAAQTNIVIPNLDCDMISLSRVTLGKNARILDRIGDCQFAHSPQLCIVYTVSDTIEGNFPDFLLILQI